VNSVVAVDAETGKLLDIVKDGKKVPAWPFPLKPPPLGRVSLNREGIVTADDTTADHAKACREF